MDNLGPFQIGYACAVVVLSYAIRGGAGFGAVTIPLLALVLPMKIIVPVVTVLGVLSSCTILFGDAKHVIWRELWQLLPSSMVGAAIGLYFFNVFDAATIAHALGAVVLCYGGQALYRSFRPQAGWQLPLREPRRALVEALRQQATWSRPQVLERVTDAADGSVRYL
ncbi:MAG: sulfite exporter TauE/SafE family protein, partial [Betaproteobacteria bacterium]|nr:sulfite exporter TauE/SafE family protein [Betaproteobacteria bacterium]